MNIITWDFSIAIEKYEFTSSQFEITTRHWVLIWDTENEEIKTTLE